MRKRRKKEYQSSKNAKLAWVYGGRKTGEKSSIIFGKQVICAVSGNKCWWKNFFGFFWAKKTVSKNEILINGKHKWEIGEKTGIKKAVKWYDTLFFELKKIFSTRFFLHKQRKKWYHFSFLLELAKKIA